MQTWVQISSGRGPLECSRAVGLALEVLTAELEAAGHTVARLSAEPDEAAGCFKSALLSVEGDAAALLRGWTGSILWICPSPYRPTHKRKNWFIAVEVFAPVEGVEARIQPQELRIDTMRASGAGGQHVNKTNSAVRVTHLPTGLVAIAMEERAQHLNRKLALARLEALLAARQREGEAAADKARWAAHDRLERGDPIRRFKGPRFQPA
ncbi:peptide chain release factor H [Myxococcota bacterium]|nr:peptide chain release factor H [Myxococcota bacterium]MBU1432568.1 peptide chain release factor H [Myxococcota bacterium]MBU1896552.1 peptide chain release factor H [Myxococcota bacterium]